jgi:hypothetical protein
MLIVIEGVDGAGKTSLINECMRLIQAELPDDTLEYLHFGQNTPNEDVLKKYVLPLLSYKPTQGRHLFIDRLHWGELIYGPLYRDESSLTSAQFDWIQLLLKSRGAVMIHLTATTEDITERTRLRGEDFVPESDLLAIAARFQAISDECDTNNLHLSTSMSSSSFSTETLAKRVCAIAASREIEYRYQDFCESFIGPRLPEFVLVGDKPNVPLKASVLYDGPMSPAFLPYKESSGSYLLAAINTTSIQLGDFGLVNAIALNADNASVLPWVKVSKIVALGAEATKKLSDLGVEHCQVPHPQYQRRFKHSQLHEYGKMIERCAK